MVKSDEISKDYFIKIPRYLINRVKRIPAPMLKAIHKDKKVAIERILYFVSTIFNEKDNGVFKKLYSKIMKENCSNYSLIIQALRCGLNYGSDSILICSGSYGDYAIGGGSLKYMIRKKYVKYGFEKYKLKDPLSIKRYENRKENYLKYIKNQLSKPF